MNVIYLASRSPRRSNIFSRLNLPFDPHPVDLEETPLPDESPDTFAERMSREKAAAARDQLGHQWILAADTVVSFNGKILGKPEDEQEAFQMISRLHNQSHEVCTGVTLLAGGADNPHSELVTTTVHLRGMSRKERQQYARREENLDRAGAYGIQDREVQPVDRTEGCPLNVLGLPLCHVERMLIDQGMEIPETGQTNCGLPPDTSCEIKDDFL